jgi:hypothetical protein
MNLSENLFLNKTKLIAQSKYNNYKNITTSKINNIKNEISDNPNILNPFKFPINSNKINNKNYNILFPYTFEIPKSTLFFYILYFSVLFFSILKYVNLK